MKRHYRCPMESDLGTGCIAEIYEDFRNMKKYQGRARLLQELEANTPKHQRQYIRAEIGNPKKQAPHTIVWSWQRWRVEFIDGPFKGWITARKIAYFVAVSNYYDSGIN